MRKKITRNNNAGFTLIELMLYASLVALLTLGIASFWDITVQAGLKDKSISAVEEEGGFAAQVIADKIQSARGICSPDSSGEDLSTLTLDSNCAVHTDEYVFFSLDNGKLTMSLGGDDIYLTDARVYISSIHFINTGGVSIEYSFTLESESYSADSSFGYSKTFSGGGTIRE